jgi:hypothetical protein
MAIQEVGPEEVAAARPGVTKVIEAMASGEVGALDNVYDLESVMALIKQSDDLITYYKELKKRRVESIEREVAKHVSRSDFLKQIILSTLQSEDEKTVRFPGLGKATRRKKKGGWVIEDENALVATLKEEGEYDTVVEEKLSIRKKELNKLLDTWSPIDKVPASVKKDPDGEGVTLTFEANVLESEDMPSLDDLPVPNKKDTESGTDLDFTK